MSDTEDGSDGADDGNGEADDGADGSDDFDKEAEREKLREQYERDQKQRQATEHMSDLLLKGATMTNAHCDDCGSPIFRYDGEAFCPTCAGTRDVTDAGAADQSGGAAASADRGAAGQQPSGADQGAPGQQRDVDAGSGGSPAADDGTPPSADAGESRSPDADGQSGAVGRPDAATGRSPSERPGDASTERGSADFGDDQGPDDLEAARRRLDERAASRSTDLGEPTDRRSEPPRATDSPVRQGEVPSMAQSRASLRRAIVSLSEQAAQSDDPGRAHDLLKGAREASEALAALEGASGE